MLVQAWFLNLSFFLSPFSVPSTTPPSPLLSLPDVLHLSLTGEEIHVIPELRKTH